MKFSIVTPVYNGERFLAQTIESVLSQAGDFEIEYIVQDGGSTDRTVAIAREYEAKIKNGSFPLACRGATMQVYSQQDAGMYDAVNKGFTHATGDIFAYINSDDTYLPGAFAAVADAFTAMPHLQWLKGKNRVIDESGNTVKEGRYRKYRQSWIQRGIYGRYAPFIEQETVFWRRELWQKAGPIDSSLRLAGDYWLWVQFAKYTPLYSIDFPIAAFRRLGSSLSNRDGGAAYRAEQAKICPPQGTLLEFWVKLYYWLKHRT